MTRERGFTLIELLVALTLLGLLAALGWSGLAQVARSESQRDEVAGRLAEVQRTVVQLSRDLGQADGRAIREAYHGSREPGFSNGVGSLLEFSAAGWRNPAGAPRPPSRRIAYALEGDEFVRYAWPVLDRAPGVEPERRVLLANVKAAEVAFLSAGQWRTDWPPAGIEPPPARPRAVRIAITLGDLGRIEKVVELIGDGA